jgi:excisionase family DNA binding protein
VKHDLPDLQTVAEPSFEPSLAYHHHWSLTKLRTIDETAELLNTSSRTVRRFIDSGALAAHRLGRSVRISEADIATFLAANRSV